MTLINEAEPEDMTHVEMDRACARQDQDPARGGPQRQGVGILQRANPYSPGAGRHPAALVGRRAELHDWNVALRRVENGRSARSVVLHGLRGMGKTVLLGEFYRKAENRHWMTVIIGADVGSSLRDTLARALYPVIREFARPRAGVKLQNALATFKAFSAKVDIAGTWSFGCDVVPQRERCSSGELEADLSELIRDLSEAAREQHRGLAIFIDEAQDLTRDELKALCELCHQGNQHEWPLLVVLAGLPSLPRLLSRAKSFAEGLFSYQEITLLEPSSAREALVRTAAAAGVSWDDDALSHVLTQASGHPYFLQAYGQATWDVANGATLTFDDARVGVAFGQAHLDAGFYRAHWERATSAQRGYLAAMARDGAGPSQSGDIPTRLGKTLMTAASFRDNLIKKGLIHASERGQVAFAAAGMAEFIDRQLR